MKILDNYYFNIEGDEFLLRGFDYTDTKKKINKYPLFQLSQIYIFENNEDSKLMYEHFLEDVHYLVVNVVLSNKKVFYVYLIDYDTPKQQMFWRFYNNNIDRKNRIKIIPYIKENKSIFMKNNKPILIGKKIKVEFNQFKNIMQIDLILNDNFLIRKILKYILSKEKSVYIGLTIETYEEDYMEEELLCIFGLNNLRELNEIKLK